MRYRITKTDKTVQHCLVDAEDAAKALNAVSTTIVNWSKPMRESLYEAIPHERMPYVMGLPTEGET